MRCPVCSGLVVYDEEKVEFVCALCDLVVTDLIWPYPYPPEYMEAVYNRMLEKEKRAREVIRRHSTANTAAALSGKDSEVALHLALSAGVAVDVVISAYIAGRRLPQKIIDELRAVAEGLGVRHVVIHDEPWDIHASLFSVINRKYGYDAVITGLRRRENRGHLYAVERQLVEPGRTVKLINPIIDWTAAEVWSYIYHHRLPVLKPYRMAPPDASLQHIV